jgi:hypothetical protein
VADKTLGIDDFARLTGCSTQMVETALADLPLPALRYRELDAAEAERVASDVEKTIREDDLRRSGDDDPTVWIRGWGEVAEQISDHAITVETLRPQYFRGEPTCRLFGRYIRPAAADFEYYAGLALRRIIFAAFLKNQTSVVEFGCGTGINVLLLADQFPSMQLTGTDWAPVCKDILAQMARQKSQQISGEVFNMLTASGWDGASIDHGTACLTVHAMEQLGANWQVFADFILTRKPGLCLHIEPLFELYDPASAFDDRVRRYHLKRGYLRGFHPYVLSLCEQGKADLIASRRVAFGGLFHEAYSILAWRPRD